VAASFANVTREAHEPAPVGQRCNGIADFDNDGFERCLRDLLVKENHCVIRWARHFKYIAMQASWPVNGKGLEFVLHIPRLDRDGHLYLLGDELITL